MASSSPIHFHYLVRDFSFRDRSRLKSFLIKAFRREGERVEEVNYIFCDDTYLLQINQQYLKHDTYTDIITFPYSAPGEPVRSDIYISIPRVRANAAVFKRPFREELLRVIFHGFLHLSGYKDKTQQAQRQMRAKEENYISAFVSRGTKL